MGQVKELLGNGVDVRIVLTLKDIPILDHTAASVSVFSFVFFSIRHYFLRDDALILRVWSPRDNCSTSHCFTSIPATCRITTSIKREPSRRRQQRESPTSEWQLSGPQRRSVELDCATVMIPTFHTSRKPQLIHETSNFGSIHHR